MINRLNVVDGASSEVMLKITTAKVDLIVENKLFAGLL